MLVVTTVVTLQEWCSAAEREKTYFTVCHWRGYVKTRCKIGNELGAGAEDASICFYQRISYIVNTICKWQIVLLSKTSHLSSLFALVCVFVFSACYLTCNLGVCVFFGVFVFCIFILSEKHRFLKNRKLLACLLPISVKDLLEISLLVWNFQHKSVCGLRTALPQNAAKWAIKWCPLLWQLGAEGMPCLRIP